MSVQRNTPVPHVQCNAIQTLPGHAYNLLHTCTSMQQSSATEVLNICTGQTSHLTDLGFRRLVGSVL